MYSFSNEKGLSLLYNGKIVLSALAPWMQATPSRPAWAKDASAHSGKIYTSLKELTEKEAVFEDEDKVASITLSIKDEDGEFALFVKGAYRPIGSKYGSHLHD